MAHIKVVLQLRSELEVFSRCIIFLAMCEDIKREREKEADKEKETQTQKGPWKSANAEMYSKSHLT